MSDDSEFYNSSALLIASSRHDRSRALRPTLRSDRRDPAADKDLSSYTKLAAPAITNVDQSARPPPSMQIKASPEVSFSSL